MVVVVEGIKVRVVAARSDGCDDGGGGLQW